MREIHASFELLVKSDIIVKNPFYRFERLPEKRDRCLTIEEGKQLLDHLETIEDQTVKSFIKIYLFTGARRSDLLNVSRVDIFIDCEFPHFLEGNVKSPNTPKHTVNIPKEVIDDFKFFLESSDSPLPFRICHEDTVTHWVKQILRSAGLSEDLRLHSLRHSCATFLALKGYTAPQIQFLLGHKQLSTTERYFHNIPKSGKALEFKDILYTKRKQ